MKINNLKYNPLYSMLRYFSLRMGRRVSCPKDEIGSYNTILENYRSKVFLQVELTDKFAAYEVIGGDAVFKVVFSNMRVSRNRFIALSKWTIPFFTGLPGFCRKQFMAVDNEQLYSGIYEWKTVEAAQKYARSFAVRIMRLWSKPFPLSYEISVKATGEIVESKTL